MYGRAVPMLLVDKVEAALDWYRDVLGAELRHRLPDVPPVQWVSVALGSIEIMLAQKEAAQVRYSEELRILKDPANFIAYLYVTDVDSLYAQIKAKAAVILDPTDRPYGTAEFAVRDPFACALVFAQTGGEPDPVGAGLPDSIGHRTLRKKTPGTGCEGGSAKIDARRGGRAPFLTARHA